MMMRRRFLEASLAGLGAGALAWGAAAAVAGAARADPPATRGDANDIKNRMALELKQAAKSFPFPLTIVPGQDALATFERLKAVGRGAPVVLGGDESFVRMAEDLTMTTAQPETLHAPTPRTPTPQEILEKAATYLTLDEALNSSSAETRRMMRHAIEENLKSVPPEKRAQFAALSATLDEKEEVAPELGEWPRIAEPPSAPLVSAYDVLTGRWLERVYIATLPTSDASEAPAWLRWGGWNGCPAPEVHVQALREWREAYGAELVAISGDVLELRVARRPRTKDQALTLARLVYRYCPDSVDQGTLTLAPLAAGFMRDSWWGFWWD